MKKFGIALAFVALAAVIGIGAGFYFTHNSGTTGENGRITAQEAESIALKDAGVSAEKASGMRSHLDTDDGHQYYEVQFAVKGENTMTTLYDYDIDSQSGTIISKEKEQKGTASAQNTTTTENTQQAGEITAD